MHEAFRALGEMAWWLKLDSALMTALIKATSRLNLPAALRIILSYAAESTLILLEENSFSFMINTYLALGLEGTLVRWITPFSSTYLKISAWEGKAGKKSTQLKPIKQPAQKEIFWNNCFLYDES